MHYTDTCKGSGKFCNFLDCMASEWQSHAVKPPLKAVVGVTRAVSESGGFSVHMTRDLPLWTVAARTLPYGLS